MSAAWVVYLGRWSFRLTTSHVRLGMRVFVIYAPSLRTGQRLKIGEPSRASRPTLLTIELAEWFRVNDHKLFATVPDFSTSPGEITVFPPKSRFADQVCASCGAPPLLGAAGANLQVRLRSGAPHFPPSRPIPSLTFQARTARSAAKIWDDAQQDVRGRIACEMVDGRVSD